MSKTIKIKSFPTGPLATNAYILFSPETHATAIIDPGVESASMISPYMEGRGLLPEMILLTHTHWDHIADVHTLKRRYEIPVHVHPYDAHNLEHPGSDGLPLLFPIHSVLVDYLFNEHQLIQLGPISIEAIINLQRFDVHRVANFPFQWMFAPRVQGKLEFQGAV